MPQREPQTNEKDLYQNKEIQQRRAKLAAIRTVGQAFPNNFRQKHISDQLHRQYDKVDAKELELLNLIVTVAGRIITRRVMGKASFITLQDTDGRIQLYISHNILLEYPTQENFKTWDLGDIIGAQGKLFKTQTCELSIYCSELRLLTKSLRPLPNKFHGLLDQEACYRQRYLDLITNPDSRKIFQIRSQLIASIRKFMVERNFLEVETPMMQVIPGGASARPFITHHNAFNIDMYLRIAPELYLKRLLVGGFERIFEINRNFRNEGVSTRHNPEFTMMEMYAAYCDYKDLMKLIQTLFCALAKDILGNLIVPYGQYSFNFGEAFEELTMKEAITKHHPQISILALNNFNTSLQIANSLNIHIEKNWGLGRVVTEIFERTVAEFLIQPTFITEYPAEVSPLARCNDIHPDVTDRFEFFICGREIGNGFSELNDPEDQEKRLLKQAYAKNMLGDYEAMFYDKDYITALEHGLPPCAGLGLGIDRMVMIFTNSQSIRDVILFPLLRPHNKLKKDLKKSF
ncbi:lysine--tRNA ligase [Candidatus Erwinia haradaeae]|uniref:Lysine--tRNA ligase n=1 Tax=Candidatus Erwinia haradaeae TaxID=1922217 RepID=A0A451DMS3_9GAMM|nr:lysine--tRNA ligase [Candidatus Erwinia haradaeae]VFP88027.1 Lysine--tRNA ligase [Candidatus Erwinia haradaeae]